MWFDDKILVECSETTHNHIRPAHWMIPLWSHSITLQLDIVVCHLYLDHVREMVDSSHQLERTWSDACAQLETSDNENRINLVDCKTQRRYCWQENRRINVVLQNFSTVKAIPQQRQIVLYLKYKCHWIFCFSYLFSSLRLSLGLAGYLGRRVTRPEKVEQEE